MIKKLKIMVLGLLYYYYVGKLAVVFAKQEKLNLREEKIQERIDHVGKAYDYVEAQRLIKRV